MYNFGPPGWPLPVLRNIHLNKLELTLSIDTCMVAFDPVVLEKKIFEWFSEYVQNLDPRGGPTLDPGALD